MMEAFEYEVQQIAASERLDLISPEQVVDWASQWVAEIDSTALLSLASLEKPANRVDVRELVVTLLQELRLDPVDDQQAGLKVARQVAQQIIDGSVSPVEGAKRIWWDVSRRVPLIEEWLRPFGGLASEWEDNVALRQEYEVDIVEAAQRLVSEG